MLFDIYKKVYKIMQEEKLLSQLTAILIVAYNLYPVVGSAYPRVSIYELELFSFILLGITFAGISLFFKTYTYIKVTLVVGVIKALWFWQFAATIVFILIFTALVLIFKKINKKHEQEEQIILKEKGHLLKKYDELIYRSSAYITDEPDDRFEIIYKYETEIFTPEVGLLKAAELLKAGEIVAIPTETVYGLASNALNPEAIGKIFKAKGRPRNNPLIVHVTDLEMVKGLGLEIPPLAEKLAEKFWAGPLTMVLKKSADCKIPDEISCGLETVAVRAPANEVARELIWLCGFPLAAPSANISGSPSPTTAQHVFADLEGRIPLITDGGNCKIGLESTVITFEEEKIRILRPGAVTPENLREFAEVEIDEAVYAEHEASVISSPGTAHKHYSPNAEVIAVIADSEEAFMDIAGEDFMLANPQAETFFAKLRELDELGIERVYIRLPKPEGSGLALYNRIIRAAEFNIIKA